MRPPAYAATVFRELTRMQLVVDLLIAGAFAVLFIVVPAFTPATFEVPNALVALVLAGALGLRRLSPAFALAVAWLAAVLQMGFETDPNLWDAAIPPVVYACAAYGTRAIRWAAFASALLGGLVAGVYVAARDYAFRVPLSVGGITDAVGIFGRFAAMTGVLLLLAWTVGLLVRTARSAARNRLQAEQADRETAAEQERVRIARDMHDVVAHSLAVVIAQSDGARLLRRTDPEAVGEALETIGATARAALADVRVLLQQLRYEGTTEVQPGLADLPAVVEGFRASGLPVDLAVDDGAEQVGTAAQLAAFRIVQESLTNALRHGDLDRAASVALTRTPHGLDVEVVSGLAPERPPRPSGGHGLIGMRERAAAVQGDLRAGPDGDRFRVRAFLPAGGTAAVRIVPPTAAAPAVRTS